MFGFPQPLSARAAHVPISIDTRSAAVARAAVAAGAAIVETTSLTGVFVASLAAAVLQFLIVRRLRSAAKGSAKR